MILTEGRQTMVKFISRTMARFARNERGATAIEYALIASGVSIVIVAVVSGLGTQVKTLFTSVSSSLK
jgi:pilus assembly protein Flp/PilA